ncbi:MAG: hypothetical protein SF187_19130 [Deltaproteobacteria bacterium]|nr:hypothetical protein [Deltaproteobacteria bacterium]
MTPVPPGLAKSRLTIVIVLYKKALADSSTYKSLKKQADDDQILVYDNSPTTLHPEPANVVYVHDATNGGLTAAYGWAQRIGNERGSEWLLLLDQDTDLPSDYVKCFLAHERTFASDTVAAIPTVVSGGKVVSPRGVVAGVPGIGDLPKHKWGVCKNELTAINSGCFVRLSFLNAIGGFLSRNNLDGVDRFFFSRVYAAGRNVFRLPISIQHELSISDVSSIGQARWQSILSAEVDFYLTKPPATRMLAAALILLRATSPRSRIGLTARKITLSQWRRLALSFVRRPF